jgi:hypothetical protein
MASSCLYCGQTSTRKDIDGFCKEFHCKQRHDNEQKTRHNNRFNHLPVFYVIKRVETIKTYNYGKLVKTEIIYR